MATKDKLPTFEEIWGSAPPAFIKVGRTAMELIQAELARPKRRKRKPVTTTLLGQRLIAAAKNNRTQKPRKPKGSQRK